MLFNRKKKSPLRRILDEMPEGHMYVTEKLIAVLLPDDRMLAITGNFKDITAEEANLKLQSALAKLQK